MRTSVPDGGEEGAEHDGSAATGRAARRPRGGGGTVDAVPVQGAKTPRRRGGIVRTRCDGNGPRERRRTCDGRRPLQLARQGRRGAIAARRTGSVPGADGDGRTRARTAPPGRRRGRRHAAPDTVELPGEDAAAAPPSARPAAAAGPARRADGRTPTPTATADARRPRGRCAAPPCADRDPARTPRRCGAASAVALARAARSAASPSRPAPACCRPLRRGRAPSPPPASRPAERPAARRPRELAAPDDRRHHGSTPPAATPTRDGGEAPARPPGPAAPATPTGPGRTPGPETGTAAPARTTARATAGPGAPAGTERPESGKRDGWIGDALRRRRTEGRRGGPGARLLAAPTRPGIGTAGSGPAAVATAAPPAAPARPVRRHRRQRGRRGHPSASRPAAPRADPARPPPRRPPVAGRATDRREPGNRRGPRHVGVTFFGRRRSKE